MQIDDVNFNEQGLIPAVVQEDGTGLVLMVAYMNRESLEKTLESGFTWFYSRSRGALWQKGETSGHVQRVVRVVADCDQDTLLVTVNQEGPGACHEGHKSCFHYPLLGEADSAASRKAFDPGAVYGRAGSRAAMIDELFRVILARKENPVEGSYTSYLFNAGIDKILKKVGEESAEVLISGKGGDHEGLVMESADLIYHLLVLMAEAGINPEEVWAELGKRRGGGGSEDAAPGK